MLQKMKEKKVKIVVIAIVFFFGIIITNSFYCSGFSVEKMDKGISPVVYCNGYTQEEQKYVYTGDQQSYIQIASKNENTKQLMFAFKNAPQKELKFFVYYVYDNGTIDTEYETGTWKKNKYTATVDVKPGHVNSYLFKVASDFELFDVYYASDNGRLNSLKMIGYAWTLFFVLLAVFFLNNDKLCEFEKKLKGYLINNKNCFLDNLTKKNMCVFFVGIVSVVLGFQVIVWAGKIVWSGKLLFVALLLALLLSSYIAFRKYAAKKIEVFGFFTVLMVGMAFAVVEPPNVGVSWDDEVHYQYANEASHAIDQQVPFANRIIYDNYQTVALEKMDYSREEQKYYRNILNDTLEAKYYKPSSSMVSWNVRIAYLPSMIGMVFAGGLGLSFCSMLIVGRMFNVLALACLIYFSMKKLKAGKIIPLMIGLIPTNIFIASNYSYDTWLTGWSILGLATFCGEWQNREQKISTKNMILIFGSMLLAVMPKLVYFPLTLICFFMPLKKFENNRQRNKYWLMIMISTVLPFVLMYILNIMNGVGQGDTRGGEAVNATSQMDFIKAEPIKALLIILNYLKSYLNPLQEGTQYLTNQAYFGIVPVSVYLILGIIVIGAFASREEGEERFPLWTKAGALVVYATIGFIVALAMYVSFTGVGMETVAGCQGRYLIPTFFPVIFVLSRIPGKTRVKNIVKEENLNIMICTFFALINIYGLLVGCLYFY